MTSNDDAFASRSVFIFGDPPGLFECFSEFEGVQDPVETALLTFKANLASAVILGNVPYRLVHTAVLDQRLNQLTLAQRIRGLEGRPLGSGLDDAAEALAFEQAQETFQAELDTPDILSDYVRRTLQILDRHLSDPDFDRSAQEILRQVLTICWSALEVLASDILRCVINQNPFIISRFIEAKQYRDALTGRAIIGALERFEFDLSLRMGDLFCDLVRLDSLEKIRDALHVALGDPSTDICMKDERLWRISQQRHLIVHRRGIIDTDYLAKTSDHGWVGKDIRFEVAYIESCLQVIQDTGVALLRAAKSKMPS